MKYDIAIIGAGPGGYAAAIRAAQLGAKVVLTEKDEVGGTCLNRGCIPSKAVIASADRFNDAKNLSKFGINAENLSYDYGVVFDRKEKIVKKLVRGLSQLIKANKIDLLKGEACIESEHSLMIGDARIEFDNLILATGSETTSLPNIKLDHKFILDTDDILMLEELPKSVMIIGSGASGIEWARIFNNFEKQAILVEIEPTLCPMTDTSVSSAIERFFKKRKIEFYTGVSVEKIEDKKVTLSNGKEFAPEIVFLAVGRKPNANIKGLDVELNGKYIKVDENLRTNIANIYAIGDVTGICQVAHAASHQGIKAVEHILLGQDVDIDYKNVPFVMYGHPEIASVGYSENQLIEMNKPYKKSIFPMAALGKSEVEAETDGFVKILANDEEILGAHVVSAGGAELIHQLAIAKSAGVSPEKLKEVIFAHPTYSEAVFEASLGLFEQALHLPPGIKLSYYNR